jgi:hypothetical protein
MQQSMAQAMKDFQTQAVRGRAFKLPDAAQVISYPSWLKELAV